MKQRTADIFSEFERIRERMEQAWREVIGPPGSPRFGAPLIEPPLDVYETENQVVVLMEIAGISQEEVELAVEGKTLLIRGERRPAAGHPGRLYSQMEICHGPFQREVFLPADVNPEEAQASYDQGLLQIILPKVHGRLNRQVKIVAH